CSAWDSSLSAHLF
nr:immunoglobulin light chain junction region [Macaca mulatta]MPO09797.1 immunoglobulin light chain junction region [Macaca mulatta]MPO11311.1 immunoglobulin light chain junction region [Macaca mulatta]MPO12000.1 immunoglobulin light chain junction region [Macaca mulatta]MPO12117.1 immunoglobulin light chain junction region [Macaca mulatta]